MRTKLECGIRYSVICLFAATAALVSTMGCSTGPRQTEPQPSADAGVRAKAAGSAASLDFLADVPEFRELHLGISRNELMAVVAKNDLSARLTEQGGQRSYHVYRKDGENVIVMFRDGDTCTGIQRMRRDPEGVPAK